LEFIGRSGRRVDRQIADIQICRPGRDASRFRLRVAGVGIVTPDAGNHGAEDTAKSEAFFGQGREAFLRDPASGGDEPDPETALGEFAEGDAEDSAEIGPAQRFVRLCGVRSDGSPATGKLVHNASKAWLASQGLRNIDNTMRKSLGAFE
jgi:hypothetical protein